MAGGGTVKKICFIGNTDYRFVDIDREILSEMYDIEVHRKDTNMLSYIHRIHREVKKADAVYGFFASWETLPGMFFARWYDKPSILVTGGYDVACEPDIDYGTSWKEKLAARHAIQYSDLVIPFSKNGGQETRYVTDPGDMQVIPFGLPNDGFGYSDSKEDLVLSVGMIKQGNLTRKGLRFFAEASHHFPDTPFILAGGHVDRDAVNRLRSLGGGNLLMPGYVPDGKLKELYQRAKVYVQASGHEGFGMAMAEAMLSGCHPVVSRRGAIPEVVGDTGIYVDYGDVDSLKQGIQRALQQNGGCKAASARIRQRFPLDKRKERLLSAVDKVIQ